MNKEEFTYEVKDFVPTLRKNKGPLIVKLAILLVGICAVVFFYGFLRDYLKNSKLTPRERVDKAVDLTVSELAGKESPVIRRLELADWFDYIKEQQFTAKTDLRMKELADLGLGIEKYASGIGLSVNSTMNLKDKLVSGDIYGSWTVVSLDVLQFAFDGKSLYLSSKDFFKETILLGSSVVNAKDMSLADLAANLPEGLLNEEQREFVKNLPFAKVKFGDIMSAFRITTEIEKTGENKELSEGRSKPVNCDCFKMTVSCDGLKEPVTLLLYIDKNNRLAALHAEYDHGMDLDLDINFVGKERLTDKCTLDLRLVVGDEEVKGSLELNRSESKDKLATEAEGKLELLGITLSGKTDSVFNTSDGSFEFKFTGNDEVTEAVLNLTGKVESDRDSVKLRFDDIDFDYDGKDIVKLNGSIKLTKDEQKRPDLGSHPESDIIDIKDFNKEVFDSIKTQVLARIDEYLGAIADFSFL